ncbi:alpha-2 adrenergic receptor [Trichonephila clavipes]|nr:alpha-2 adrenergic receptor [Trichonephila clavipes]
MKIGNNGHLVLGPFDESTPCLMTVLMNCQTKLRINPLPAVKSVAILESNANLNFHTWKKKHSLPGECDPVAPSGLYPISCRWVPDQYMSRSRYLTSHYKATRRLLETELVTSTIVK